MSICHLNDLWYYGVPQESILELLLFIIYMNKLLHYLTESKPSSYVNDTVLYCSGRSIVGIVLFLWIDLAYVDEWHKANKSTFYISFIMSTCPCQSLFKNGVTIYLLIGYTLMCSDNVILII